MEEMQRIMDQLKRMYAGEAWHGPSLREVLAGVTAEQAAARPLANAHSIWEIVLHVSAWKGVVRQRLEGEAITEPEEGDWPRVGETTDAAWQSILQNLERAQEQLEQVVAGFDPSRLDAPPRADAETPAYRTLHGTIQHDAYHAGQIALLKKG